MKKKDCKIEQMVANDMCRMKEEFGIFLLKIRQRHNLTRQFISDNTRMGERNLYIIEKQYDATLDEVCKLYTFYHTKGYVTKEDTTIFQGLFYFRF